MKTKVANKKTGKERGMGRVFMLRYLLSLIFGWGFILFLIAVIGFVVDGIIHRAENSWYYPGEIFTFLLSALVIFGAAHLLLAFSVDKVKLDVSAKSYAKVFGTIYNIGLIGMATGFAMTALYPLFGWLTGLTELDSKEVLQLVLIGGIAAILLVVMVLHQAQALHKLSRLVYPVVMGGVSLIAIVLFLVIPVRAARNVAKDEPIIDDLELIQGQVMFYTDEHGVLPGSLADLELGGSLHRDESAYEYKAGGTNLGEYYDMSSYILCADGFVGDTSGMDVQYGNFGIHTSGRVCFDLFVSVDNEARID